MMLRRLLSLLILSGIIFAAVVSDAKVIRPSAEKGENKIYIRADGLACYFCAYGMERFFKKSGRIAWYDMDMKEGIVEVGFIKGKPILDVKTLKQYVYDAGFTPRGIKAEFIGRLIRDQDGSYRFEVTETAQTFPVEANAVLKQSEKALGQEISLMARVEEDLVAPMWLVPKAIRFVDE